MCTCDHLRFEDGRLYLVCIDCGQVYGALDKKGGQLQYTKAQEMPKYTPDTRHGRWTIPRIEKDQPPKATILKKPKPTR